MHLPLIISSPFLSQTHDEPAWTQPNIGTIFMKTLHSYVNNKPVLSCRFKSYKYTGTSLCTLRHWLFSLPVFYIAHYDWFLPTVINNEWRGPLFGQFLTIFLAVLQDWLSCTHTFCLLCINQLIPQSLQLQG